MAIKGFLDQSSTLRVMRDGMPTTASKPPINGTFPTGHPKANVTPAPSDIRAKDYAWGRSEYGANGDFTPSSLPPGVSKNVGDGTGTLAQNDDATLNIVQEQGLKREDRPADWQERAIGAGNVPDAHGSDSARSRQASSHSSAAVKVPAKTGAAPDDDFAVRYGEGMKRI